MVKIDARQPAIYALIVVVLLGLRVWWREQERRRQLAGAYLSMPVGKVISITPRR